jgi:hypothetical protein
MGRRVKRFIGSKVQGFKRFGFQRLKALNPEPSSAAFND